MKTTYRFIALGICLAALSGCADALLTAKQIMETRYPVGTQIDADIIAIGQYKVPLPEKGWKVVWANGSSYQVKANSYGIPSPESDSAALILESDKQPHRYVYVSALLSVASGYYINTDAPCVSMKSPYKQEVDKQFTFDKQCDWIIDGPFGALFPAESGQRKALTLRGGSDGTAHHRLGFVHMQKRDKLMTVIYAFPEKDFDRESAWKILQAQKARVAELY